MSAGGIALRRQIDLPGPVAMWVLTAHAFTLAAPFVVIAVVWRRRDHLIGVVDHPSLLLIAAALLLGGSVFEAAQNTEDTWYYTGPRPAFADAAFTLLITAGLGTLAIAAAGDSSWPWATAGVALVLAAVLYQSGRPGFPALAIAGVAATVALYEALDQPVVILLLLATGFLNAYFLEAVVRTHAQSLHGAIALSNGVGLLVVAYALQASGTGNRFGWVPVLVIAGSVVGLGAVAWPTLRTLSPTPRPSAPLLPELSNAAQPPVP